MKMFLVGMLVMWVVMNLIVWVADLVNEDLGMRKAVPLFYILTYIFTMCIPNFIDVIKVLPLCIKYKINPFYTKVSTICCKLNTNKAREEWLSKLNDNYGNWERVFAQYPTEEDLKEIEAEAERIRLEHEELKKKLETF